MRIEEIKKKILELDKGAGFALRWVGDFTDFNGDELRTLATSHTNLLTVLERVRRIAGEAHGGDSADHYNAIRDIADLCQTGIEEAGKGES